MPKCNVCGKEILDGEPVQPFVIELDDHSTFDALAHLAKGDPKRKDCWERIEAALPWTEETGYVN